jgi:hypothetical protein
MTMLRCWPASALLVAVAAAGCGKVVREDVADAPMGAPGTDAAADSPKPLGSQQNPAFGCGDLPKGKGKSGVFWVRHPDGKSPAFQVYCEQEMGGGGWAMVLNSVGSDVGKTTEFWQIPYAERFTQRGTAAPGQNYYGPSLYMIGTTYMDVVVDLKGKVAVAAMMTTSGIDPESMHFNDPLFLAGNVNVYNMQFAMGWGAPDHDADAAPSTDCSATFSNVTQHYGACWYYNLGADAEQPYLDNGFGPHVEDAVLGTLGLGLQDNSAGHSRVSRIARFTRW